MAIPPQLNVEVAGLKLRNPVLTASGTFGYGREFDHLMDLNRLGAIVVKGLSLEPAVGNPPPRIVETPCGMLNAIGLENVGIDAFLSAKLPFLRSLDVPLIVNIYGRQISDYAELARRLSDAEGVAGIEINISCPNVKAGGLAFGVDPDAAYEVVSRVRAETDQVLIAKLSPNVTDITRIARSVEDAGADALSLINTLTGMVVDVDRRRPVLANITGGLSGPAIRPIAVRMVWQVSQVSSLPIIGIGGITSARDALEFIIAGATAVEVGTANFIDPAATLTIIEGLERYLEAQGIARITDLVGTLQVDE
jgi:dihydroorotate dehydrogenase (NAD+) catalytic subunit